MKTKYVVLICVLIMFFSMGVSVLGTMYCVKKKYLVISVPDTKPIVQNTVIRKPDPTFEEALGHLKHYDSDSFVINYDIKSQNYNTMDVSISGNLYQRTFSQEVTFPIATVRTQNWKFIVGGVVGGALVAGCVYGAYQLLK